MLGTQLGGKFCALECHRCVSAHFPAIVLLQLLHIHRAATIAWSLIWSAYTPSLPYQDNGLMYAWSPWSGNYNVTSPIWTSAQFTQFTQPGWRFLPAATGGSGLLPGGGAFVMLVPPDDTNDLTIIIESLAGQCLRCQVPVPVKQNVTFTLGAGLPGPGTTFYVWLTNSTTWFVQLASFQLGADSIISLDLPSDHMITITTLQTGGHGSFDTPIPADTVFPLPYGENFDGYAYDALAAYFSDQAGSFAVRNGSLWQVTPVDPGPNGWIQNNDPNSIMGDYRWVDYHVSIAFNFTESGLTNVPGALVPCDTQSAYQQWTYNNPEAGYLVNPQTSLCINVDGCASDVIYYQCVTSGGTCCGADCYNNLMWNFEANGQLQSALNNECLTYTGGAVSIAPCGGANQTWTLNKQTSQLQLGSTNLCLSTPQPQVYAQVCARITTDDVDSVGPIPGYCLTLNTHGNWTLLAGATVLQSGALNAFDPTATHRLGVVVNGTNVQGLVDLVPVVATTSSTYKSGLIAIGSGYHSIQFDNFNIIPIA
jgi:hypothetical protein